MTFDRFGLHLGGKRRKNDPDWVAKGRPGSGHSSLICPLAPQVSQSKPKDAKMVPQVVKIVLNSDKRYQNRP